MVSTAGDHKDEFVHGELLRQRTGDQGTEGVLSLPCVGFACFSLELPWRDNRVDISCIPAGTYRGGPVHSPRFGRVYGLHEVPGRTHILLHAGNLAGDVALGLESDVAGCILLGARRGILHGQRAVLASRRTVSRFQAALGGRPILLKITDATRRMQ